MKLCAALVSVTFVAVVATAAPSAPRPNDSQWTAPPSAAAESNPLAGRPDATGGGRKLFRDRCVLCHGEDGRGTRRGPDLTSDAQAQADGELFWKISSGNTRTGMPSFSYMPAPERWQLVLFLRSLRRQP